MDQEKFTQKKLEKARNLVLNNLCKHYHDENCERCLIDCPYDLILNGLNRGQRELINIKSAKK